ncbi:MAG: hypothetical protein GQ570_14595 [Helicobacteraceae bacterium]|nr:hypothetical protein [Helicobacteraceae bacterium]
MPVKLDKLKNRYISLAILILILNLILRLYFDNQHTDMMLKKEINNLKSDITLIFEDELKHLQDSYQFISIPYLNNSKLKKYLQNRDREKLLKHMQLNYTSLKKSDPYLEIMHFFDSNNTTILRMHRPEQFNDSIVGIRPLIEKTTATKMNKNAFEVGKNGVSYRISVPFVGENNTLLGILEYGIKPSYFASELAEEAGHINVEILVKSDKLKYLNTKTDYEQVDDYSLILSETIFKKINPLLDVTKEHQILHIEDKYFLVVNNLDLKSIDKEPIAKIIVSKNITALFKSNEEFLFYTNLTNVALLLFMSMLMYYIFNMYTKKIKALEAINIENNKKLFQHSKLAQMGEMISMIAHQWRQPLAGISAISIDLNMQLELDTYNLDKKDEQEEHKEYFTNSLNQIGTLTQSLTSTIDDFRNFYKIDKQITKTLLSSTIEKALHIIQSSLKVDNIKLIQEYNCSTEIDIIENEVVQVVLNIIKNAQDNINEKKLKNSEITIEIKDIGNGCSIEISDNGGGIRNNIMENIFDPYFSTKSEKNGTGLGLYMSKIIIEDHHNAHLNVKNITSPQGETTGVCFSLEFFNN